VPAAKRAGEHGRTTKAARELIAWSRLVHRYYPEAEALHDPNLLPAPVRAWGHSAFTRVKEQRPAAEQRRARLAQRLAKILEEFKKQKTNDRL
jgi:hypothetical protein